MDTDYYAEALRQFDRRTWREDGRGNYLARLEKRLFELSRDLTIADWKAIRDEDYWSDIAWVHSRSWPTTEKEIAINEIRGKSIRQYLDSKKINL